MEKGDWVTIMADRYRGGLYVGVTADLIRRVHQHRKGSRSIHVRDYAKTTVVSWIPHPRDAASQP